MKQKLPSAHQHGDAVTLHFGDAGSLAFGKITKVSFDPGKVFYDVELRVKDGMVTRLRMIDSAFLEKVKYQYAFQCSTNHPFIVDQEYFAYEDHIMTTVGHVGGDNPLIKFVGYNNFHNVAIFESPYRLNRKLMHYIPVYIDNLPNATANKMVYSVMFITNKHFIPDGTHSIEPESVKSELTEYDKEIIPQFSIKDIDKIFDDERRNHGTNPIDSINRMYRKLLALKEKGAKTPFYATPAAANTFGSTCLTAATNSPALILESPPSAAAKPV